MKAHELSVFFRHSQPPQDTYTNFGGCDVFVLQSIAINPDHYLFEMLIIIDALKRSSAKSITAIIPYLGYSRQDRKNKPGVPITAKLVAKVLEAAGIWDVKNVAPSPPIPDAEEQGDLSTESGTKTEAFSLKKFDENSGVFDTPAGITNLITFDLHADQIEGFYETNVYHLHCQQLLYGAYLDFVQSHDFLANARQS